MARPIRIAVATIAIFVSVEPALAQRRPPRACAAEIGRAEARRLAQECLEARPAAPALCRPETPCDGLREMIAEACRAPGSEAKEACRALDPDDDDDDEDE